MKRGDNPNICVYLKWMCRGQSVASPAPRTLMRITGGRGVKVVVVVTGGGGDQEVTEADLLVTRQAGLSSSDATSGSMVGGDMIDTCDCVLLLYEHHTCLLLL